MQALFEPAQVNGPDLITILWHASLFTAKESAVGLALGGVIGFAIAVVLSQSRFLQRGFIPYIVASQTIPLLAIAPMVVDRARHERRHGLDLGRHPRRVPHVLPCHDQRAARTPVG